MCLPLGTKSALMPIHGRVGWAIVIPPGDGQRPLAAEIIDCRPSVPLRGSLSSRGDYNDPLSQRQGDKDTRKRELRISPIPLNLSRCRLVFLTTADDVPMGVHLHPENMQLLLGRRRGYLEGLLHRQLEAGRLADLLQLDA